nr:MAG TPA: hypothetical protein [Caudoviricetes sp.]
MIIIVFIIFLFYLMQRYEEFLKLPNKMHFNYVFKCIFNV